jgi:hypothetical protein
MGGAGQGAERAPRGGSALHERLDATSGSRAVGHYDIAAGRAPRPEVSFRVRQLEHFAPQLAVRKTS